MKLMRAVRAVHARVVVVLGDLGPLHFALRCTALHCRPGHKHDVKRDADLRVAGANLLEHQDGTQQGRLACVDLVSQGDLGLRAQMLEVHRLVPFGAVLAPKVLTPETECLVNITQQCDLNAATRPNSLKSTQFAVVLPVEVLEHRMPAHDSENASLVARSLMIDGKEFDFKLAEGRQLALPIPQFVMHASERKLGVVGRLRHDIASHFLSATANHMTRFASLKTTRVEVLTAHVLLYGNQFPQGGAPVVLRDREGNPVEVQVAKHRKQFFFQDDTSMRLALWLKEQLAAHYPAVDIDASRVCNSLSVGLGSKQNLIKIVEFVVKSFDIGELAGNLAAAQAPAGKVSLMVVTPP